MASMTSYFRRCDLKYMTLYISLNCFRSYARAPACCLGWCLLQATRHHAVIYSRASRKLKCTVHLAGKTGETRGVCVQVLRQPCAPGVNCGVISCSPAELSRAAGAVVVVSSSIQPSRSAAHRLSASRARQGVFSFSVIQPAGGYLARTLYTILLLRLDCLGCRVSPWRSTAYQRARRCNVANLTGAWLDLPPTSIAKANAFWRPEPARTSLGECGPKTWYEHLKESVAC